jgi:SAM-dependent methyltransferase
MDDLIRHPMKLRPNRDELGRQHFVSGLRSYILNDMAAGMAQAYEKRAKGVFEKETGRAPENGDDVHKALKPDNYFKFYSSFRCNAQEMVWRSILPALERGEAELVQQGEALATEAGSGGATLTLDPELDIPRYVTAVDVHLMPGNYTGAEGETGYGPGALYDHGLAVFSMGLMGSNLDDIGRSVAGFVKARYPDFKPERILDMGCTIGHNTVPWAKEYPDAEIHGIDVAAPCVRYGYARARANDVKVHFHQQNAEHSQFEDGSFDVVFSSMFLHELTPAAIKNVFAEAHRLLRAGGLMIHMELPPNDQMNAYDGFYLDWDSYYNQEPFYKPFRDQNCQQLCMEAGFAEENYVQFVIPSREGYGEQVFQEAVGHQGDVDRDTVGRLAAGIQWYAFGAWK